MDELLPPLNFYCSITTDLLPHQIAALFEKNGWQLHTCASRDCEISCEWASLVLDDDSPLLMNGYLVNVLVNSERVLSILREAGIAYTAELDDGDLKREFYWDPSLIGF